MTFAVKAALGITGIVGAGGAGLIYSLEKTISASTGFDLKAAKYPWPHKGAFVTFDHAAMRRGYEVYKNVCSACHGVRFLPYRRMIGVLMTEEEAKKEAAERMYEDGPNENGEMFMRPGKLYDYLTGPYGEPVVNNIKAKLANNGAEPPDLSLIVNGTKEGENYILSLLTGYRDAPAGIDTPEGTHYNPYFAGGNIAMAPPLYNEVIEFSDGTPATLSQCAKDVTTFLAWVAMPEHDYRKRIWLKCIAIFAFFTIGVSYVRRVKWANLRARRFEFFEAPVPPKRHIK